MPSTDATASPVFDHAQDERLMRAAYAVAKKAMDEGSHPFGAILVGPDGAVLMEQGNGFLPHHDMTAHAERVLMTRASQTWRPDFLKGCTMYTSAEPCAMCAGAAYWAGIGRIVYGLSEEQLKTITGNHPENPTLAMDCRTVLATGQREVVVTGPMLEDEGAALHDGVWNR